MYITYSLIIYFSFYFFLRIMPSTLSNRKQRGMTLRYVGRKRFLARKGYRIPSRHCQEAIHSRITIIKRKIIITHIFSFPPYCSWWGSWRVLLHKQNVNTQTYIYTKTNTHSQTDQQGERGPFYVVCTFAITYSRLCVLNKNFMLQ